MEKQEYVNNHRKMWERYDMNKTLDRDERLFKAGWKAREEAFKKQIAEEDVQVIFSDAIKLHGIKIELQNNINQIQKT